jgi:hypothetical protein
MPLKFNAFVLFVTAIIPMHPRNASNTIRVDSDHSLTTDASSYLFGLFGVRALLFEEKHSWRPRLIFLTRFLDVFFHRPSEKVPSDIPICDRDGRPDDHSELFDIAPIGCIADAE